MAIYAATDQRHALEERAGSWQIGGLRLDGWAAEVNRGAGDGWRIRLDWTVTGDDLPPDLRITTEILNAQGVRVAAFDGAYRTPNWAGSFPVWQALMLPDDLPAGEYAVRVIAWVIDGPSAAAEIGPLAISAAGS